MKKYILAVIILIAAAIIFLDPNQKQSDNIINNESVSIFPEASPTPFILPNGTITEKEFDASKFLIFWMIIPQNADVSLIPNFKEKLTGEKMIADNGCDAAINGGFYLATEAPLGFFYSSGKQLGKTVSSNIANALVSARKSGEIIFSRELSGDLSDYEFAFQTGPLIYISENRIRLTNDEKTRRSLLGKDAAGNLYLISVTEKDEISSGPYLADIPVIFYELKNENKLILSELINLDGGSASFFHSGDEKNDFTLSSWAPVGSLICVRLKP